MRAFLLRCSLREDISARVSRRFRLYYFHYCITACGREAIYDGLMAAFTAFILSLSLAV